MSEAGFDPILEIPKAPVYCRKVGKLEERLSDIEMT